MAGVKTYCNKCGADTMSERSAVIDGVYYRHLCANCLNNGGVAHDGAFNRDRQREDFKKDMIQPFDNRGNINREFVEAYPAQSKSMFGDKIKGIA